MGSYKRSLEYLNSEYKNRASITLFGRQATMLRLLADSYEVRLLFEKLLEKMKEGPIVIEDSDLDYLDWADEAKWQRQKELKGESIIMTAAIFGIKNNSPFAQTYANYMKDAFGGRLNNIDIDRYNIIMSSVVTSQDVISDYEFELAIEENIRQLRRTLIDIHNFINTNRWRKNDYAFMYLDLFEKYKKVRMHITFVKSEHKRWLNDMVAPDLNDFIQRRRELLIGLFSTGFLDAMKRRMHVPSEDDLQFCVIKDDELMPDLTDTLKWYAAFKRLCPKVKNVFRFNEFATLGKYIYDNRISLEICKKFFHFVLLIEIVQQELEWIEHPELKPEDEDETVENFVSRVKQIMLKAEDRNGESIEFEDNKHNKCTYKFEVDGKLFSAIMDEIQDKHPDLIIDYLDGKLGDSAVGVTKVCPFIGCVVNMHIFNRDDVRNKDFEPAFQFIYGEKNEKGQNRSFIQKMSETKEIKDKPVFKTIKTIFEEHKKAQLLKEKKVSN